MRPRFPERVSISWTRKDTMKRTIQAMIDELAPKPKPPLPADLDNQILSRDPLQRLRQLDQQAQEDEERIARS